MTDHRISREQAFMQTAQVWAQRSTCFRRNVGAVVVVDSHIISQGYNGAPAGDPHCDGLTCYTRELGCIRSIHAEANAIKYCPSNYDDISKTMFTTESPCIACATIIHQHRFSAVYYLNEYRLTAGIKYLLLKGTRVFRMTPAGMIMHKLLIDNELTETVLGE
jgi:dCMP deaminase